MLQDTAVQLQAPSELSVERVYLGTHSLEVVWGNVCSRVITGLTLIPLQNVSCTVETTSRLPLKHG